MRWITDNIRRTPACKGGCVLSGICRLANIEGYAAKAAGSSKNCETRVVRQNSYTNSQNILIFAFDFLCVLWYLLSVEVA